MNANENQNTIAERFGMISRQDFAALAGKSLRTIDRWHALGLGPARTTIGRTPYYRLEAVKAWLLDNETTRNPSRVRGWARAPRQGVRQPAHPGASSGGR